MHPILFSHGSFFVGTYGLMIALGLVAGALIAIWRGRQIGIEPQLLMDLIFWAVVSGVVGSRIAYIIVNWKESLEHPAEMIFSRTNFVFLGGVVMSIPCCYYFLRWQKADFLKVADVIAPSLSLGHAFGRIGCLFAGCCYGKPIGGGFFSFLGIRYPKVVFNGEEIGMPVLDQMKAGLIPPGSEHSLPVWPVPVMESLGELIIFTTLMLLWSRRRYEGQLLLFYGILYGLLRTCMEFLRGDESRGVFLGIISTSQFISLAGISIAIYFHFRFMKTRPRPSTASLLPAETVGESKHGDAKTDAAKAPSSGKKSSRKPGGR